MDWLLGSQDGIIEPILAISASVRNPQLTQLARLEGSSHPKAADLASVLSHTLRTSQPVVSFVQPRQTSHAFHSRRHRLSRPRHRRHLRLGRHFRGKRCAAPNTFALWMRLTAIVAAVLFLVSVCMVLWGAPLLPTSAPLPAAGYPFLVLTFVGWIWTLVKSGR